MVLMLVVWEVGGGYGGVATENGRRRESSLFSGF
jgi:hypothetical protein